MSCNSLHKVDMESWSEGLRTQCITILPSTQPVIALPGPKFSHYAGDGTLQSVHLWMHLHKKDLGLLGIRAEVTSDLKLAYWPQTLSRKQAVLHP